MKLMYPAEIINPQRDDDDGERLKKEQEKKQKKKLNLRWGLYKIVYFLLI